MPFRFVNLPRVAVLGVVRWCRWWPAGAGAVHFRRILQEIRPPPGCFPFHIVLICKGMYRILQVPFHFPHFCAWIWLNSPSLAVSARFCCRLLDGQGMEPGRPPPLAVSACQLFSPEHRPPGDSPSLPSPPLFSLGHCLRLVVSVPLWFSPASGVLPGSLVLFSALLGMVVYGGIFFFIQPRPELTRAHARGVAAALSRFFALCGAADGVFLWGSVSGHFFGARKAWRGVSARFLYFRGHCQKSTRA